MQDSYLNNNLYHVINPMDLNRNYNHQLYDTSNSTTTTLTSTSTSNNNRIRSLTINNRQSLLTSSTNPVTTAYSQQSTPKRAKLNHTSQASQTTSTNLIDLLKLESKLIHSDGESNLSNESDSNSSSSSCNAVYTQKQQQTGYEYAKPLLVATKIEPYQLKNLTNVKIENQDTLTTPVSITIPNNTNSVNTQINLIKINSNSPKENTGLFGQTQNKLPVVNNLNHKTIIQYKQLHTANGLTCSPLKSAHNTIINLNTTSSFLSSSSSTQTQNIATSDTFVSNNSGKVFPKPPYSYSCLIAMALRNSDSGNLPVSDIYDFIM